MSARLKDKLLALPPQVVCEGFELLYLNQSEGRDVIEVPVTECKAPGFDDFVSLMKFMKKNYSFTELDDFFIEGGQVLFRRGGRRIEISLEPSDEVPEIQVKIEKTKEKDDSQGAESRFSRLEL